MATLYPSAPRTLELDDFPSSQHGTVQVENPYKWMEDMPSSSYKSFISAQNTRSSAFLSSKDTVPYRLALKRRLETLHSQSALISVPVCAGDAYYYRVAGHGRKFPQWFYCDKATFLLSAEGQGLEQEHKLFHDEETDMGTVNASGFSQSGRFWAYSNSINGSEWSKIHVRDTKSGEKLEDEIVDTRFTAKAAWISWLCDAGFFYQYWPDNESKKNPQLRFHRVGDVQHMDELVWQDNSDHQAQFGARTSFDGSWVFLFIFKRSRNSQVIGGKVFSGRKGNLALHFNAPITGDFRAEWEYAGSTASIGYFHSTANNGEVVSFDLESQKLSVIASGNAKRLLKLTTLLSNGNLAVVCSIDVHDEIHILSPDGAQLSQVVSPILTVIGIEPSFDSGNIFILESTFHSPPSLWVASTATTSLATSAVHLHLFSTPLSPFKTTQVFYPSTDKTLIPMFLTSSSVYPQTSKTPALIYIYGGFGVSVVPHFRPDFLTFLASFRGILAIANVRGGGEKGSAWYAAAQRQKRQVLFDDLISAVNYLKDKMGIQNIALMGESMGALNVSAVMVQQPSLVQGVICNVGPFDILRRQRTSGQDRGTDDVGDPNLGEDFDNMVRWSPLENLKKGEAYPALLLMAGAEDDLVPPFHSAKMAAAMQWASSGGDVSLRVVEGAGHGGNNSALVKAQMSIERWTWVSKALGWEFFADN